MRAALLAALLVATQAACVPAARPAAGPAPSTLAAALDSIFADTAFAHAHWGVLVKSLETGETLYQRDARKAFTPASTMKLVTGAVALAALGPDYRYRTTFSATGQVRAGVLQGDLVVRGSGDPTLSERFHPDDARAAMRAWADSLRARGITRIAGGIIGVDSAFSGPTLGAGWAWDDLGASYSAEVGALQFNEGSLDLQVVPSRAVGEPAVVILDPATQYVHVNNRTVTTQRGTTASLALARDPSSPAVALSGIVPVDTSAITLSVAVRDPAGYFLAVLRETLREAGVTVEGQALAAGDWPEARTPAERALFTHSSAPLREILPAMMRPSQNWIAETLLRTVGRERRGEGSARAGAAVADSVLRAWQIPVDGFRMADGSGLSRYDLVTPDLFVALLARMRPEPSWELWHASLPEAGESGTLENRMRASPLRGRVHAKTGTLSGVRSLAGYLETPGSGTLVFAVIVNHHTRSAAGADRVTEAALARLLAEY